jgi:raffinose/stachyose/melibiose transport system permease protein
MIQAKRIFAVVFLAPATLLYTLFVFGPIAGSVYYSMTNWRIGRPMSWVWFRNYTDLFNDPQYWIVAKNSFSLVASAIFIQVPIALLLAYAVHWIGIGFRFYRSVLFMPVVIAPIAIGLAFTVFLNGDVGAFNKLLQVVGLGDYARNWLADSSVVLWAVNVPNLWHHMGLFVIIFIAAMRGIPSEIFEAAALDGASRIRMFPTIVVPLMRESIVICVILAATIAIRSFDHSWIMTQGGPGQASSYFATLIYKRGFLDSQFAYATTISVTLLIYVLLLVVVVRRVLLGPQR